MSQSLSKLYVHIIFHVKNNAILIREEDDNELYAYIGGIIKSTGSFPIIINGVQNHIHILSTMSKNISLADFVSKIKANSSLWIKTKGNHYKHFEWQGGYAGYSVSQSGVSNVEKYIKGQKEHHKTVIFKEEYIEFLKESEIDFDEQYLWT
jgi:REP element-mobilizing transposase RayT